MITILHSRYAAPNMLNVLQMLGGTREKAGIPNNMGVMRGGGSPDTEIHGMIRKVGASPGFSLTRLNYPSGPVEEYLAYTDNAVQE